MPFYRLWFSKIMRRTLRTLSKSPLPNKVKENGSTHLIDKDEPLVDIIDQSNQYNSGSSRTGQMTTSNISKERESGHERIAAMDSDFEMTKRQDSEMDSPEPLLSSKQVFIIALMFRGLSLCSQTFFQPDEFYQAYEPAHRLVFGTGYLTWEWRDLPEPDPKVIQTIFERGGMRKWILKIVGSQGGGRMRSWIWPGLFALVYKGLQLTGLDNTFLIVRLFTSVPSSKQSDLS